MPDKSSNYAFIRLNVFPDPDGSAATWSVVTGVVRKGIPHASLMERGTVEVAPHVLADMDVWELIGELAELQSR